METAQALWTTRFTDLRNNEDGCARPLEIGVAQSMRINQWDRHVYDKVGLLQKRGGYMLTSLRWRFVCLDFNELYYSPRLPVRDVQLLAHLDDCLCHQQASTSGTGEVTYGFEITERIPGGENKTIYFQASSATELRGWTDAITIASKVTREVPVCVVYAGARSWGNPNATDPRKCSLVSGPGRLVPVAYVLLGTWRRKANELLAVVDRSAGRRMTLFLSSFSCSGLCVHD